MKLDFAASLKEFFFDIIGFLIPGVIVLLIIKYIFDFPIELELGTFTSLLLAYVIGYSIFSFSLIKAWIYDETFIGKMFNSSKSIRKNLSEGDVFRIATGEIDKRVIESDQKLESFNSYRNLALSETKKSNQLVYTFMFRAELFDQLHTIAVLTFILCATAKILFYFTEVFDDISFYWLILFLILVFSLRWGWNRFYTMSMNIPFSLYLSKIKKS